MSDTARTATPTLTAAAIDHLDGRPLLLRASPRHGCCGGQALVPVAEVGQPDRPDDFHRVTVGGTTCFVDRRFGDEVAGWTVDVVGIARWRRLQLEGTEGLDPHADHAP